MNASTAREEASSLLDAPLSEPLVSGIRSLAKAPPPLLEVSGVSKRFGALVALDNVDFRLTPGSFHALLGENGAGKSTLVKCIMGFYQADQGRICVGGGEVRVESPREAQRYGIGMVYQHFTLVENMTVAENLVLARADVPRVIDWEREHQAIRAFMDEMPFRLEPGRLVRKLAAGEKQKLEILKQLYAGSRIVILDEPTSVLTPSEADEVLGMLRQMAHECRLSVAMITHKFREVMAYSDEVTVLRRGRVAGTGRTRDLTPDAMAEMMVGAEVPRAALERHELAASEALLKLDGLCANDDLGLGVLRDVSFGVSAGEIVGIAGVSGNGQEELVEVLAGQRPSAAGEVKVGGKSYRATRREMREQRVRLLPEAPLKNACVGNMSVAENIGFRSFDAPPCTELGVFVKMKAIRARARAAIREYGIKTQSPDSAIAGLSGGNVQRAVLSRELTGEVSVLIAANPCFGLDFAATSEIRNRIMAARNAGSAVLLVSSDLEEVFALSDRILVMSEGRIVYESRAADADVADIGRHLGGGHA